MRNTCTVPPKSTLPPLASFLARQVSQLVRYTNHKGKGRKFHLTGITETPILE